MKIGLNRELCIGSATCIGFMPSKVKIGEDGHAVLLTEEIGPEDAAAVADAVANCPVEAIRLIDPA